MATLNYSGWFSPFYHRYAAELTVSWRAEQTVYAAIDVNRVNVRIKQVKQLLACVLDHGKWVSCRYNVVPDAHFPCCAEKWNKTPPV